MKNYWNSKMLRMWYKQANILALVCLLSKIEEVAQKICLQARKKICKMATINRKKMVGDYIKKWKSGNTIIKVSEKNGNKKERRSNKKENGNKQGNIIKKVKIFSNKLRKKNRKVATN